MIPLYEEVYKYKVNEIPNYSKCRFLLEMELMECFCKSDKYYSFLQNKINFIGFVIAKSSDEEIGICDDCDVDEEVQIGETGQANLRDNHKLMIQA